MGAGRRAPRALPGKLNAGLQFPFFAPATLDVMTNFVKYLMVAVVLSFGLAACEPNEAENAGENAGQAVENAAEDTGEAVDEAADNAGEAVNEAAEDTEDAAEDATDGN